MVGGVGAAAPAPVADLMRDRASTGDAGTRGARPSTRGHARALPGRPSSSISESEVPANRSILAPPRGTTSLVEKVSLMYPFCTREPLRRVVSADQGLPGPT